MPSADKSIGRVFIEAGVDLSQLNKGFDQIVKAITDVDGKVAAYGKRLASNFEAAYNPTLRLGKQLEALASQGKTAGELIAVFGDRIQKAMETVARTGAEPSKIVANLAAQMKVMNQATEGAGSGFARLGQAMTDFARNPLAATQAGITSILEKMGPLAVGIGGVVAAIGLAAYEFGKFVLSVHEEIEHLENLSVQTGLTTQDIQALQQVEKNLGVEGLDLARVIGQLGRQMDGADTGKFLKALENMAIPIRDDQGQMRDFLSLLSDFGERLKEIRNPTEQFTIGISALGPRARDLIPLLVRLDDSLKNTTERMKKEGLGYTEETKRQADELHKDLNRLSEAANRYWIAIKGAAIEGVVGLKQGFREMIGVPEPSKPTAGQAAGELVGPPIEILYRERQEWDKLREAQEKAAKAAVESAERAAEAQKKRLAELDRIYDKHFSQEKAQLNTSQAAWYELDQIINGIGTHIKEFDGLTDKWFESLETVVNLQPRGPWAEVKEIGQTFEDLAGNLTQLIPGAIKEIDTFVDKQNQTAKKVSDVWRNQVSTIVTDWSRGIADILVEGGDFGKKLTDIFKETAKSILRMLIEQLFNPLKNLFSNLIGGLFGGTSKLGGGLGFLGSLGGILGTAVGGVATGGLLGMAIPQTASGKVLGGIAGGVAGVGAYGAYMGATTAAGTFGGISAALASIPVWGWTALGATAIGTILYKIFTKSSVEAGAMEAARDLGGINIGESMIKSFYSGLGLSDKQSYGIRKDLLTSPAFISQIAVPAAESQGRVDALLKSLEKVTVDTRIAASGYLNFRAAVEQGIKTGNWETFNKQWSEAFAKSQALTSVMPDFASKLAAVATAASDAADAATGLSSGMQGLLDAITSTQDAADDMYGTFLKTGEILPQLAAEIQKYGGNLEVFQKYASLGGLRENLTAIGNLISGLNDILPDLNPIQKLLSGGGIDWAGLQAMNIDPSKLIPMADLITFETKWEDSVKQFQETGKLLSGSALEQSLWKFGGAQGMTGLQNYGQGFNTITPDLLDMTKSAMDIAYKTERESALDYLKDVQTTMESEIDAATDAIVAELKNILAAIQAGNAATAPPATGETTGQTATAQGGLYIDMRGATVFGYDDFQARVNQAVKSEYYKGGMAYAIP